MLEGAVDWAARVFESYGLLGLFIVMIIGSSPIPIPVELVVVTVIALGAPPLPTALFAGFGASLGGLIGYYVGYGLISGTGLMEKHRDRVEEAHQWLERYGAPAVFIFALTPLPYDAMAIAAGGGRMSIRKFYLATLAGRLIRYLFVAQMGYEALRYLSLRSLLG
ncbi:MAG: DedA family protein [Methanobacteriota archaeon]|nr:MAG: DedA family protein [Euryarchaeota archaeon]